MIALITGGARRLGSYISAYLASLGHDLIIHYNSSLNEARATADLIKSKGAKVNIDLIQANFLKLDEVDKLVDYLQKNKVDILINNAAYFSNDRISNRPEISRKTRELGKLDKDSNNFQSFDLISKQEIYVSSDSFNNHMKINCEVPVLLMQAMGYQEALDDLPIEDLSLGLASKASNSEKKEKNIINILDYAIYKAPRNFCSYSLSKFALSKATKIAARALAPNVRVNGLALGQILVNPKQNLALHNKSILSSPLQVKPKLEEINRAINFLLEAKSTTGQIIKIDGGISLPEGDL